MKKTFKKALALLLSVLMLMSLTSVGIVAFAEEQPEAITAELKVGSSVVVPMIEWGTAAYLTVVPEKTDVYVFSSDINNGQSDVYATLLNENGNRLTEAGNAFMCNANFKFGYYLEAGKTYTLRIDMSSKSSETITVDLSETTIEEIVVTSPPVIVEGTNGYTAYDHNTNKDFYYYNWKWLNSFSYNVIFKDGYVMEYSGNDGFAYGTDWYVIETRDNQYEEHWYAGNTYNASISIFGVSATVPVTITESPIKDVVFENVEIIEGTNGYLSQNPEKDYFHYNWEFKLKYTVYFNDGTATKAEGTSFEYNGQYYNLNNYYYDQYSNPFTTGNTYNLPVDIMGKTYKVSVSIIETPVESFVVTPSKLELIENLDGNLNEHSPDGVWFRYDWSNSFDYTLTLKDGTVYTSNENSTSGIDYNGEYYSFVYTDDQYSNHWEVGKTYKPSLSILGATKELDVTIVESPVESITVNPVNIREGKNGHLSTSPDGESVFIYWWTNSLEYTINFKDGTSATYKGQNYSYNNRNYYIRYDNFEQRSNPLVLGENKKTLSIFGQDVEVTVNVNPSPIKNITIDPIIIKEYTSGYYNNDESGNSWYYYNWHHKNITYTVELTDGTIINTSSNYGFQYNGDYYNLSYSSWDLDQYETHLYAGNTYTAPATLDGKPCEIKITIVGEQESDGFKYIVQDGTAIITAYNGTDKVVNIPSTLGGNTVVGIMSIYDWEDDEWDTNIATQLTVPDTVTMLSESMFEYLENLEILNLGSGISEIDNSWLLNLTNLKEINVSENNEKLASVDGVVFDKNLTELVAFPPAKQGIFKIPATVTDMDVFFDNSIVYSGISLDLSNNPAGYKKVDGVIYNSDMTKVLLCDKDKTGAYVMPDTVIDMADAAFANSALSEVTVSKNVTNIVYCAFTSSLNLSKVTLPEGLTDISAYAFKYCKNLESITLPETLGYMQECAFAESGIKSITIPAKVEYVGDSCFYASALENITISNGVGAIGSYCFSESQLKSLHLPDSVQYLGSNACSYTPLKDLTLSRHEYFNSVGYEVFYSTDLESVVIPKNVTYIGEYAFSYSTHLEEVVFESDELYIDIGAFSNCPINGINLKEGEIFISDYAFYGNKATSIKLPQSVTHITYYSFANSKNLTDIDVSDNLESLCGLAFDGSAWLEKQPYGPVYLENYLYGYKYAPGISTEVVIEEGTKLIANYAFANNQYISKVHIPASVENIGERAFFDCLNLSEITVDEANKNYYVEDNVLYGTNGEILWAKPTSVSAVFGLVYEFEYGEPFYTEMDFCAYINTASEDRYNEVEAFWSTWFDLPIDEVVSGYDPYKVGTQTVTIHFGCVDYEYEVTVKERTSIQGDANGDGVVNVSDIATIKKLLAGLLSEEEAAKVNSDIDENGVTNVGDLAHLKKMIAGLI